MTITSTENYLVTQIESLFQGRLRKVDSLPGALNEQLVKIMAATTPAVYVTFLSGRANDQVLNRTGVFTSPPVRAPIRNADRGRVE